MRQLDRLTQRTNIVKLNRMNAPQESSKSGKEERQSVSILIRGWWYLIRDMISVADMLTRKSSSKAVFPLVFLSIIATWFVYVPIHELLHVAACIVTGGSVEQLVMGREYGAELLKPIFPFIEARSTAYAGRLTAFTPNGDLGYLATDFGPFIITLFPGVFLLHLALQKQSALLVGPGAVVGLAPFANLTGDYFEMGSIISTRLARHLGTLSWNHLVAFRSDDIFRLLGSLFSHPEKFGMNGEPGTFLTAAGIILTGSVLAILAAGWTYHAGRVIAFNLLPEKIGLKESGS